MTRVAHLDYPKANIKMLVSSPIEQAYRIRACAKEPWTVEWIESMPPGSVLYDIGANVGSYSLLAAALGHTVVAIEPAYANYARLCENVLLNGFEGQITPLPLAVGGFTSVAVIETGNMPGGSGGKERVRVVVMDLTELVQIAGLPRPTHVKVDVDGGECAVIRGAGALTFLPWLIEVSNDLTADVLSFMGEPKRRWTERPHVDGLPPLNGWWYGLWEP